MKVKCIKNTYEEESSYFLFFNTKEVVRVQGLTVGKIYEASVFSVVSRYQDRECNEIRFLIFDDDGEWEDYSPNYFEPIEVS